jgi:hypothetical protein
VDNDVSKKFEKHVKRELREIRRQTDTIEAVLALFGEFYDIASTVVKATEDEPPNEPDDGGCTCELCKAPSDKPAA